MDDAINDTSFGIVPIRKKEGVWEIFLVLNKNGPYWSFPKGHPHPGESPHESASRELSEETGLKVIAFLPGGPFVERYSFKHQGKRIDKLVYYFLAKVEGDICLQRDEILDGKWTTSEKGYALLTFAEGKGVLKEALAALQKDLIF